MWMLAAVVQTLLLSACTDDTDAALTTGLELKSFMPTVVMSGCDVIITGSNLELAKSVVFPGNVEVADFELVTSNQIKVAVPDNISPEGGTLKLVSDEATIESRGSMTLAEIKVKSMIPGDEVNVGDELTIFGSDLNFIKEVVFPSKTEGELVIVPAIDFVRKAAESLKVVVPSGVFNGMSAITLITQDGSTYNTHEINIISPDEPSVKPIVIWEGNEPHGDWADFVLGVSYFQDLAVGQTIRIYYAQEEGGWAQIDLRDGVDASFPGFEWTGLVDAYPDGYADLIVTQEVYDRIKTAGDGGLHFRGYWYYLTKVELIPAPVTGPIVVWEGNEPHGDWADFVLGVNYFQDLAVGQTIRIYYTQEEGGWAQIDLRDGVDASFLGFEWTGLVDTYPDGYADLVVTQEVYDRIKTAGDGGLHFRGYWYYLTKVELI